MVSGASVLHGMALHLLGPYKSKASGPSLRYIYKYLNIIYIYMYMERERESSGLTERSQAATDAGFLVER